MLKISEVYKSKYLRSGDFQKGKTVPATIKDAAYEEVGPERELKPVAYYDGISDPRGMVLNRGNAFLLAESFGQDPSQWLGRHVELFIETVPFRGKMVDGLRVRPAPTEAPKKASAPGAAGAEAALDEDLPF
jgi:hypothetical protein